MGIKADDLLGAWACSGCHDAIDRRADMGLSRDYVRIAHLEGADDAVAFASGSIARRPTSVTDALKFPISFPTTLVVDICCQLFESSMNHVLGKFLFARPHSVRCLTECVSHCYQRFERDATTIAAAPATALPDSFFTHQ
jgi:hypothetical protein